jgi:hypothetical protein
MPAHGTKKTSGTPRAYLRTHLVAIGASCLLLTAAAVPVLGGFASPAGAATTVTQTFGFNNDTLQGFTVPAGVTSLTITATGGQGSWGGTDASGSPPAGGYQGVVHGSISVTPGQYLTIAVGAGADEPYVTDCVGGNDWASPDDPFDAVGGINPLTQYNGGAGGAPGTNGCSGYGGAGGAATAVEIGSSPSDPTSVGALVAGGGGGDGGSGQYPLVLGQIALASYVPQSTPTPVTYGIPAGCTTDCAEQNTIESPSALPAQPSQGQDGVAVFTMCGGSTDGNNADQYFDTGAPDSEAGCDGGGGAGGGGGASGGAAGNDQFGSGASDEWYGQGGSPGANSTGGIPGLNSLYAYFGDTNTGTPNGDYSFADPGAQFDGSVVITYSTGVPGIPTGLSATAGAGTASLSWTAPNPGADPISDYVVQYSSDGGATWTTDDTGSTSTSTTVSGLTDGSTYIFEVQAVNSDGSGPFSVPTGTVAPSSPPAAPTINSISPEDGALQVDFTPPASSAPITGYRYQLNGSGPWHSVATTTSPLTIAGLTDGTPYAVQIEAVNRTGPGPASDPVTQTPVAVPGAPTISSVTVGSTTATVGFTPGASGGSTITGYQYSVDGGATWVTTSTSSPVSVAGLSPGTGYSFELEAVNAGGPGAPADASFATNGPPTAPTITAVQPGDQTLTVTATAPASNGAPITDYEWSTDAGLTWQSENQAGTPCQTSQGSTVTCTIAATSDGATPLANGTAYPVELRADNSAGTGAGSDPVSGTPATTPGAPSIVTGADGMVAADQSLTVAFTAPADDGGSPVTGYQYSTDAGATWHDRTDSAGPTDTTMAITTRSDDGTTPLTDGVTYDVEIRAGNGAGYGPGSAVAVGIPLTVPTAPSISSITSANGALGVTFTPGSNGGSVVTSYDYSVDGGPWTSTGSLATSTTLGGLTNGTTYSIRMRADNSQGGSDPSAAASGTPATNPGQPVVTSADRGDATISVTYTEASTGGSPVTSYQYSTDAGVTWQTAASDADPLVITTLSTDGTTPVANGTQYPVEIRAVNAIGSSVASAPLEVAPARAPGAPTVTLTPGDDAISVAALVADDGGSSVTGMEYSVDGGPWTSTGTTSSSFTIPGLVNGTSYSVAVRADNAIGAGRASAPADATPMTAPGAPEDVLASSDSESADVTWSAPASDGGAPVTGYTATAYTAPDGSTPVGEACTSAATSCTITGLSDGTTYYVGVAATNTAGTGVRSDPLQPVTPIARPQAPTLTGISPGDSYLSVSFSPGDPGGDPVTSYQYSLDGGATWTSTGGTDSPFVVNGLTDGTAYSILLEAVSAAGTSPASEPLSGTPYTYPSPVSADSITAYGEDGGASVTWAAPSSDGGAPISDQTVNGVGNSAYTVTAFSAASGGSQVAGCTTSGDLSCSLNGLDDGTTYYISIQAGNAAGLSARSTPRVAVTPSASAITSDALPDGEVGAAYDATPSATGGSGSYTWTVTDGSLPDGLVLDPSTGEVSGTPTGAGTSSFTLVATDLGGQQATQSESVTVVAAPSITSDALPGGEVGVAYDATPSVTDGSGSLTWTVADGTLPDGLVLDPSTGEVSGTPTGAGTSSFTLVATDGNGQPASQSESIVIVGAPSFGATGLPDGEVGVAYDATPTVTGGSGSLVWTVDDGALPDGLVLDPSTGEVTGTPTGAASYAFTLGATDAGGLEATQSESVTIDAGPSITSDALPGGEVGVAYDATPSMTGGSGSITWTVADGTLPDGLVLDPSTGEVSGTPTGAGTSSFTLVATDGNAQQATQSESVTIVAGPSIGTDPLPNGEVGVAYDAIPSITGGSGTVTWTVADGTLPDGLVLDPSTGEVSGTPTGAGSYAFTLVATDGNGQQATHAESVTIVGGPSITSDALPGGEVGVAYDATPSMTGGSGSTVWTVTDGTLPDGLVLDPTTGEVSGTPTGAGTVSFTLVATDGHGLQATQSESVTIDAAPSITSDALPGGEVGVAYDASPSVTGGTGTFTWTVSDGTLPDGLVLDPTTGEVSGTPTGAGTSSFTLVATDGDSQQATQSESVTIDAAPSITSDALPGGEVGAPYAAVPSVTGGTGTFTWSVSDGTLPAGLALDPSTGEVSGTPTVDGSYVFTLVATDGDSQQATQSESVTIDAAPSVPADRTINGTVGVPLHTALTVTGGSASHTWAVTSGDLPVGITLVSTGILSGTPTGAGTSTVTVEVTDGLGRTATGSLTIVITPTGLASRLMAITPDDGGYWIASSDGAVAPFGNAQFYGSEGDKALNQPVVGIAATPDGSGYWLVGSDGGVFSFGDAQFYGSEGGAHLNRTIIGMVATPDGHGYWMVASDGGVFSFGDAQFYGSEGDKVLNKPVVGMAATSDGHGYWMVASDGGVFSFGDAQFYGSEGDKILNQPVVGMAATSDGHGYWMVASDGGVFTFGDAQFHGSAADHALHAPVDGIAATSDGRGYWLVATDGGVFTYGDAPFHGSAV